MASNFADQVTAQSVFSSSKAYDVDEAIGFQRCKLGMLSPRTVLKIAAGVLAAIIVIVLLYNVLSVPSPQNTLPSRESAIPADAVKMTPDMDIHPPILHSEEWMDPVPLSSAINTAGGEDSPFVMPDGNTLYFFFTPDVSTPAEKQLFDGVTGIYVSTKLNGSWSNAQRVVIQDPGKLALDGAEFVQDDVMWFASAREGYNELNLFTARFIDGKWADWQYAGDQIKEYQVGEMHITADWSELYFHSPRPGGKGQLDIWVTRRVNGEWQQPENIEIVNTEENEGWPFISQNGDELWFLRTYMGSPAIYRSKKVGGAWSEPELILSQFAGEPSLDIYGNLYFVHHYYSSQGEMVEADIYVAYRKTS